MTAFVLAVLFTLGVSACCSLLEAFILSTTTAEIEDLKRQHPGKGTLLETFKDGIDETSSAILTLNTVANTMGASLVGFLAGKHFAPIVGYISAALVLGILFFSEIIPKNLGVAYRRQLRTHLVYPLLIIRIMMFPFSYLAKHSVKIIIRQQEEDASDQEQEIILLAEKRAKEGALTSSERDMISNALSLDDVKVSEIMTPRTVVHALESEKTIGEICRDFKNLPFARIPIYNESVDDILGLVRRRDLLQAYAEDKTEDKLIIYKGEAAYIPETATALHALQLSLKKNQQLLVVVDEFGSTSGVITMEDIIEHLLGREIYEESDIAVDMRELARKKAEESPSIAPNPEEDAVLPNEQHVAAEEASPEDPAAESEQSSDDAAKTQETPEPDPHPSSPREKGPPPPPDSEIGASPGVQSEIVGGHVSQRTTKDSDKAKDNTSTQSVSR